MLYIVPTPVGNLQDITLRALDTLKKVDIILAEDTRTTSKLLNHFGIQKPMQAYHQHNEHQVQQYWINQLLQGKIVALVSDAGTPGISDPAFLIVRACVQAGVKVECLPGPTAFVPALINSGLPTNRFCFEGFLPIKKGRQTLLKKIALEERTIILYESPVRLLKTLQELILYFGETRPCSVSREISKLHEETIRGTLQEVINIMASKPTIKGEIVIVLHGKD
jgi:16S rRNA (cytidine1402-2'-O)-methyltransferase